MTATNKPMANDLLLVNVVYLSQNSSQSASPINQLSSVAPLLTAQPEIVVRKFAASVVSGSGSVSGSGGDANFTNVSPASRLRFTVQRRLPTLRPPSQTPTATPPVASRTPPPRVRFRSRGSSFLKDRPVRCNTRLISPPTRRSVVSLRTPP
jgi:hypothetical protein